VPIFNLPHLSNLSISTVTIQSILSALMLTDYARVPRHNLQSAPSAQRSRVAMTTSLRYEIRFTPLRVVVLVTHKIVLCHRETIYYITIRCY